MSTINTTTEVHYVTGYGPHVKLTIDDGENRIVAEFSLHNLCTIAEQLYTAAEAAEQFAIEMQERARA